MKFVVAIDGTASSGKSTTAKLLAKKLGFTHLDTGAMYRAITYLLIKNQAVEADDKLLQKLLFDAPLIFSIDNNKLSVYLDKQLLSDELRSPEVDSWVSPVAQRAFVRAFLLAKQRQLGANQKLVCEGRDIGSVIFPDAELKVYMKCGIEERAKRRHRELLQKGIAKSLQDVLTNLKRRDEIDSTREIAPLVQVEDAFVVDTTNLTIEQQVEIIEAEVLKRMRSLS